MATSEQRKVKAESLQKKFEAILKADSKDYIRTQQLGEQYHFHSHPIELVLGGKTLDFPR